MDASLQGKVELLTERHVFPLKTVTVLGREEQDNGRVTKTESLADADIFTLVAKENSTLG